MVRHVAVLDGAWVALLGYGSAVLRCTARDQVIGWSDADRVDRLPMLAGQQRFCVLPGGRPHLASAVLARSLARLPGDYLDLHNQIVLAAETFTDPARHTGACYAAAGFACAGSTAGYARGRGRARVCLPRVGASPPSARRVPGLPQRGGKLPPDDQRTDPCRDRAAAHCPRGSPRSRSAQPERQR